MAGLRAHAGPVRPGRGFPALPLHHALAATVGRRKVYFDARDEADLVPEALDWADVYAKVGPAAKDPRIVVLGPSFAVRVFGLPRTLAWMARMGPRSRERLANVWRPWRHRAPVDAYAPGGSRSDEVFALSSLWAKEPECNAYRARFLRTVRAAPGIRFEGGFAPRRRAPVEGFDDLIAERRYPIREYMEKTRRSAVVFSTPAVLGCHGWKLAEFLALGKAILSTPLERRLPAPLVHGEHVHFVDGSEGSIEDAVLRLLADPAYRARLEAGARAYYDAHLAPERAVASVLEAR